MLNLFLILIGSQSISFANHNVRFVCREKSFLLIDGNTILRSVPRNGYCFTDNNFIILVYSSPSKNLYAIKVIYQDLKSKWFKKFSGSFLSLKIIDKNILFVDEFNGQAIPSLRIINSKYGKTIYFFPSVTQVQLVNNRILFSVKGVNLVFSDFKRYVVFNINSLTFKTIDINLEPRKSCGMLDMYSGNERYISNEIVFKRKDDCGDFEIRRKW